MKIGLISDTHGHLDKKVMDYFADRDEIWHAGDIGDLNLLLELKKFKPTRAVYGNIDGHEVRNATHEDLWFQCEELQVFITHIGGYPPKYNKRTKSLIIKNKPDIFICGHSHILKIIKDPVLSVLHINPGAAGVQGFHKVKTLIRFEVIGREIKDLQVIELGTRA